MATGGQIQPPSPDWVSPFDLDGVTNDGYPFIAAQTPPPGYSPTNGATIWVLDGSFDGYPYIRANGLPCAIDHDRAATIWGLNDSINDGYPYIRAVYPVIPVPPYAEPPEIRDGLMVYPPETRDFSQNGICILRPVSAVHDITFGQAGEITVVHPFDPDGRWQFLQPNNIILAPLMYHGEKKPQAFRIYRRVKSMDNSGKKTLTVYARHVFYDLMYSLLQNIKLSGQTPSGIAQYLFRHQVGYEGDPYFYNLASDAWYSRDYGATVKNFIVGGGTVRRDFEFQDTTIAAALIGGNGSVMETFGLEFYADNFYFSLYAHNQNVAVGNVLENSFDIRYGFDMTNVSEDIDYTNAYTHLFVYDNLGALWGTSTAEEKYGPYVRPKQVKMSYSNPLYGEAGTARLAVDGDRYWNDTNGYAVSYTAKYAPLQLDKSRDFIGQLDGREVGDTGTVRNESIGIVSTDQKIISKKTDLLTGITLDIKLGNAPASLTRHGTWSDTARSTPPSAVEKQIEAMQSS